MKPELKPPGTKRLKPDYDELLSTLAFKFNLRRYNKADVVVDIVGVLFFITAFMVRRCGLTLD
jgi:hypothetical protein